MIKNITPEILGSVIRKCSMLIGLRSNLRLAAIATSGEQPAPKTIVLAKNSALCSGSGVIAHGVLLGHPHYNKKNFPQFVMNHGNWDIYANDQGACAAIPTEDAALIGCSASHFGNMDYVRKTLQPFGPEHWLKSFRGQQRECAA